jgi:CRP-like cAMP-binding protein
LRHDGALALKAGVECVRAADGRLVLVLRGGSSGRDVFAHEEALLALIDGSRNLGTVIADAGRLVPPRTPFQVLELLGRLDEGRLIARPADKSGDSRRKGGRLRGAPLTVPVGGTAGLAAALGRGVALSRFTMLAWTGLLLAAAALAAALFVGRATVLLGPLWAPGLDLGGAAELAVVYVCAAAVLSLRGLLRGIVAAAAGAERPGAVLQFTGFVVHLDLDPAVRRTLTVAGRRTLAVVGLGTVAAIAGGAGLLWLGGAGDLWQRLAATAWLVLLLETAPYLRSDVWNLIGIAKRLPHLGRRSASYVFRRLFKNMLKGAAPGEREGTYVAVGSLWLVHASLGVAVVGQAVLPSAFERLQHVAAEGGATLPWLDLALVGAAMVMALILLVALASGLLFGVFGLGVQLLRVLGALDRSRGSKRPASTEEQAEFVEAALGIPFLAALGRDVIVQAASGLEAGAWAPGAVVLKQGEPGDRFYFVRAGQAQVVVEDDAGLVHPVAVLGPGNFFGEVALVEKVPRTATVKAAPVKGQALELLSLDGERFVELVKKQTESDGAADALEQLRNAARLRNHPLVSHLGTAAMRRLLQAVAIEHAAAGQVVVRQGDVSTDLYIVREGMCSVRHQSLDAVRQPGDDGEPEVGRLGRGAWFGEVALLEGGTRTASVRAEEASVLLKLPASAVTDVILADLDAALTLQRLAAERRRALDLGS